MAAAFDDLMKDLVSDSIPEDESPPPNDSLAPSRASIAAAISTGAGTPDSTWTPQDPPPAEQIPLEAYQEDIGAAATPVALEDFYAYMPMHSYIFRPTRELWSGSSINSRIPPIRVGSEKIKANIWLDQNRPVEQMTWAPGFGEVIEGKLVDNGGWIERAGVSVYNLYRPALRWEGDASKADRWIAHIREVFPDEYDHIVRWFAHRVQRPGEKINHGLVLGGSPGIGKDTIIEPVIRAVGPWNCNEVSPGQLMGRFTGFLKSVVLRVSEARDQGDAGGGKIDRYAVHEHCKTLLAAPPTVLRVDEKNIREHSIMNVCGVIFTTNHSDGLYLPPDDRRHFVAWSESAKEEFSPQYWADLYRWYECEGGHGHVAAYLAALDLSGFNPKAPPPRTAGFWRMVDAARAPEDAELADVIEGMGSRKAVTIEDLAIHTNSDSFREWLRDRRNSRHIPHRLESAGYVPVRNNDQTDGRWKVHGKNVVIYAKRELPVRDRIVAAAALCREGWS